MTNSRKQVRVLVVCLGNICRSPMAEGILRHQAYLLGQDEVLVESAGISSFHVGEPPDPRALRAARDYGVDISSSRARTVTDEDFALYDYMLGMDENNIHALRQLCPNNSTVKIDKFTAWRSVQAGMDVPDPYYGKQKDFDALVPLLVDASRAFLNHLRCGSRR